MGIAHRQIAIRTPSKEAFVDITAGVQGEVAALDIQEAFCLISVPHTTAGITINEYADPDVRRDILTALNHIVPDTLPYRHFEGNSTAHVKTSLMGSSVTILIENKKLKLGTWQGIFLCEFDGPRTRKIDIYVR